MNVKWKLAFIAKVAGLLLLLGMLTACDQNGTDSDAAMNDQPDSSASRTISTTASNTDGKLTYWAELNGNAASIKSSFNDVPFFQEWQRRTGVNLQFIRPPANQAKEAINVLLTSGELPDMIEYEWSNYPGGPEKAIKDGYILRLNDIIDQHAPHLKQYLSEHPDIDMQIRTASGSYYAFPFIQGQDKLRTYQGPIIRKDWLDELGLDVPTTIDEWHTMLQAFKDKKGADAPLTFLGVPNPLFGIEGGGFIGAFGIKKGFFVEDGHIKFGAQEPEYKAFLALFREWYAEGLIDKNLAAVDSETQDTNMTTGRSGASIWNAGAGIGTWLPILQETDPNAQLVPAPYPVMNKGDRPKFGQLAPAIGSSGVAISSNSRHVEEAARMLDYGYGPEGHLLFNFGIEGVSFEMKDGYPTYTDTILKNPDKWSPAQALAMYTRASYFGPFVQDTRYMEQYYILPEQKEAVQLWSNTDAVLHQVPTLPKTEKESTELSVIMQEVNKVVDEMSLKIIFGMEPVDSFDMYVEQIKSLQIERAIEIQQQALERYNRAVSSK
ncbi:MULTISPECIES: extracellular solute-binding protein [unclassified Paenibacillus]|uniref:extracellular solute-binding protein n=1 Tax=unclassified Paenibacillus TaxID=185978 RepID=UPI000410CCEA|nr:MULTISPECIES: extracellular solute-binding protein [unclassified Paenibacillus]KGP80297.1 ABC transporter substrate-binding protein [Paenibacillus sp. MAEPY2]KGP81139.1 ABC transporter substrate-binding protein [Paenibacillus sp. MAEPY1]